jgi:hypothetical protein
MRAFRYVIAAALFGLTARAGEPRLGQLVSAGTSVNNFTTAAPFKNTTAAPLPRWLGIQCDVPVRYVTGRGSSTAATSTDVKVDARMFWEVRLHGDENALAIIPVIGWGSATCQVYAVLW